MDKHPISTRRAFLKTGALAAAPVAAVAVPAVALADDGSRAKLARLEDLRAIEALQRKFVRALNGTGECGDFIASADAVKMPEGLRSIAEVRFREPALDLAESGRAATLRIDCTVEIDSDFTGTSTVEQMARFQGHGSNRRSEDRVLAMEFVKDTQGWRIARARLA